MKKIKKEEMLKDAKRVANKLGYFPSSLEYVREGGKYSRDVFTKRFGSWPKIKEILNIKDKKIKRNGLDSKRIIQYIKKNVRTLEDFCNHFDISPLKAKEMINELIERGHKVKQFDNGNFKLDIVPSSILEIHKLKIKPIKNYINFAVVSDTHLGSIHEKLDELHDFYDVCKKEGINDVFHAGDLIAGTKVYYGQENEIKEWGADSQVNYFCEKYPKRKGITTRFITGNHDLCYFNSLGKDIGIDIANKRDDMIYLGQYGAMVIINKLKIELSHPSSLPCYAISYPIQKTIEAIPGGKKPDLLFQGHLHQAVLLPNLRNVSGYMAGCFEGQSLWLYRKKLQPNLGGWIVKVGLDESGSVRSVNSNFVRYYESPIIERRLEDSQYAETISC